MRGAGSADYYLTLAQDDYYISASEFPGYWLGKGASQLGLKGQVHREVFRNLLDGMSPDGSRPLVQNAQKEDRQSAWDLTFSAPKSVSLLWALGPPEIRAEIERLHQESVLFALGYLEARAGLTRRGKGGAIQETAALSFAVFQHGSSRALDPHLHSHSVLLNVGVREDGSTGALVTREIFRRKMKAGSRYRERFALRLTQTFGVTIQWQKVGFRVVGVPERLCRVCSKRRRAIQKKMQAQGRSGAIEAKLVTLETRPAKIAVPREELLAQWQEVGKSFGWSAEQVEALLHRQPAKTRTEPPGDGIVQDGSKTESDTRSTPREQRDEDRPQSAKTMEPIDPGPSAVPEDTRAVPQDPAEKQDQAPLPPGQLPDAPSSCAPQGAEVEPAQDRALPMDRSAAEESHPNDASLKGSVDLPVSEALPKQGSDQELLSGVSQQDGLPPEREGASIAVASQDLSTSAQPLISPAADQPGTASAGNLMASVAASLPENTPAAQPQPGGSPLDQPADQRPSRAIFDPPVEVVKGHAPAQQLEEAARASQPDNSGRQIPAESAAGAQLLLPLSSPADQTNFAGLRPGEKPTRNVNGAPPGDKAAAPTASREPDSQTAREPVEARHQVPHDQSSAQKSPDQVLPHDPKSIPPPALSQGQAQIHAEPDVRQEISSNMGAKVKGLPEPERDQNTLNPRPGPEALGKQPTPRSGQRAGKEASQGASRREESDTTTRKRASRHQARGARDQNHRASEGNSRTGAERENRQKSQRDGRRKETNDRAKKQASPRSHHNSTEKGPDRESAAPQGLGIAWHPLFPKAPFWSLASLIRVPGITFPTPQSRWDNVRWEKQFRFLKISVEDRILFPDAPKWSRLRGVKHRAVHVTIPKEVLPGPPPPRWWSITWKQGLPVGELRVQQRNLFRRAPRWSPFYGIKHKALHLTPNKSKWTQETHQHWQAHKY